MGVGIENEAGQALSRHFEGRGSLVLSSPGAGRMGRNQVDPVVQRAPWFCLPSSNYHDRQNFERMLSFRTGSGVKQTCLGVLWGLPCPS